MWTTPRQLFPVPPSTEESCPLAGYTPPTSYEPNVLDDFHYSETTEMSSRRNPATRIRSLRTCVTRNSTMRPSGKRYLHYCSFGREESADRRQDYHSFEESLLPAQSFSTHTKTGRPVHGISSCRQKPSREMENKTIRILRERQKDRFSMILEQRFKNSNFKLNLIGDVSRN